MQLLEASQLERWCDERDESTFDFSLLEVWGNRNVDLEFGVVGDLFGNVEELRSGHGHIWRVEIFDAEFTVVFIGEFSS